jgi:hypothetical protein
MEFRPGRRALVINYLVTFAVVGAILYAVRSPEQVTRHWYDPEYSSHMSGNYGKLSCNDCHIQPFTPAEPSTCWTSGCHSHFDPKAPPAGMLLLKADESGKARPNHGANLAFHMQASEKMSCEACHPSHLLPTRGAFNNSTIQIALNQADLPPVSAKTQSIHDAKKLEIFHAGARKFAQDINNCASCHVAPQNTVHLRAAAQSCNSCHGSVSTWKTGNPSDQSLSSLFEGHPKIASTDSQATPLNHKWSLLSVAD